MLRIGKRPYTGHIYSLLSATCSGLLHQRRYWGELGGHDNYFPNCMGANVTDMARLARIGIPQLPHHVTQRGNLREPIFFKDGDHEVYRSLLAEQMRKASIRVWTYCLMPNHVHLILVPNADWLGEAWEKHIGDIPIS